MSTREPAVVLWPPAAAWGRAWRGIAAAGLHPFLLSVTATVAWAGVGLSVGLLPLALAGVPVFGLTALACRGLSAMERSRARGTLGLVVEPPRASPRARRPATSGSTWPATPTRW